MQAAALSVLVVDDHEPMRTLMCKVLARAGFGAVREAASAEAALAALATESADLVLADQTMPGMNGIELLGAIRADARHAETRLIILSGHAGEAFAQQARAAGADAVLVKPIAPSDLIGAIARVLGAAAA